MIIRRALILFQSCGLMKFTVKAQLYSGAAPMSAFANLSHTTFAKLGNLHPSVAL